ncbi:MAG TPA: type II secretion system F family protein [Gaiellaceae bacterium]|nr:type II secretion system F family protein [Gaiellaceae bacterium]
MPIALAALVVAPAAYAGVRIQAVDTSGYPAIRLTVLAPLHAVSPRLTENSTPVTGYSAVNLGSQKAIVLALDRSQSMLGRPFANALSAARTFIGAAGPRDHVGVVAFGSSVLGLGRFSASPADAQTSLSGLSVDTRTGTALYDAIVLAASHVRSDNSPGRAIVVVTDGADVSSTNTLQQAVAAAHAAHAAVYTIGIGGPSFTPGALQTVSRETGGSYRQVARTGDLDTVYAALASELDRTWQLSYVTAARPGMTLDLTTAVPGAGTAHATARVLGGEPAAMAPSKLIPAVGYSAAGTLAVAIVVGLLVLLACCFWFAAQRGGKLRARIEPHLGLLERGAKVRRENGRAAARVHVANGVEHLLGNLRQFRSVQLTIERADLPVRAGELLALCAGLALSCGLLTAASASPTLVIVAVMAVAGWAPYAYVSFRAKSRIKKFENQLPDLLITIAASLKAGHSFRQGIQSVVDEGAEPAAKEFRRVLTETQLGKTMDDALADLSVRIGSKNLAFVINAVTIQRQIGGSLAGLFDMVADTVRQRQQFGRKVKGLTAMGRMSAYVLVGLPFFIAAVVSLINGSYMAPLYQSATGQKMLIAGVVMIVIGSLMLKKIVSFRG